MRLPLLTSLSLVSLASLCVAVPAPGRVLVVGGSGRVGGSTVRWLRTLSSRENLPLTIAVGGRSRRSFERAVAAGVVPPGVEFVEVDVDGPPSALDAAVDGCNLVVHTAGPFQGGNTPTRVPRPTRTPFCCCCCFFPRPALTPLPLPASPPRPPLAHPNPCTPPTPHP